MSVRHVYVSLYLIMNCLLNYLRRRVNMCNGYKSRESVHLYVRGDMRF